MPSVAVVGCGLTKFGKTDKGLIELLAEAGLKAIDDAGLDGIQFDDVLVANMASGEFNGLSGIANALVGELSLEPAAAIKIENTSGSGGAAVYVGWQAIASGKSEYVLVVGGEKMSTKSSGETAEIIASLTHLEERVHGITLPSLAALSARQYMQFYGAPREALAKVAVKNHDNALLNPLAQFHKKITIEDVLNSPIVCDPLRLYDYCPITDGAAAVVLTTLENAKRLTDNPVVISGIGFATDYYSIQTRKRLDEFPAVRRAAEKAYRMAGKKPSDIHVVEVHDMATILEILQCEDLGFFSKGEGWKAVLEDKTALDGELPVNTSGGLKAKGHPIGATGVAQVAEIFMQLQQRCGERQVDAKCGLTCNIGGYGNGVVVTILEVMRPC
ncbi:MAG: thiolase domain-containing protein [Nitrososphaeria archaeon]|nr:thiolase domain-containing protein [Nitrososphaeria archaeon]